MSLLLLGYREAMQKPSSNEERGRAIFLDLALTRQAIQGPPDKRALLYRALPCVIHL